MRRMKLYHFQVLKLQQYEDLKRMDEKANQSSKGDKDDEEKRNDKTYRSEVKIIYHFFHKLLNKFNPIKDFE